MAFTRIAVGGPGKSLGTVSDKAESAIGGGWWYGVKNSLFAWVIGNGE